MIPRNLHQAFSHNLLLLAVTTLLLYPQLLFAARSPKKSVSLSELTISFNLKNAKGKKFICANIGSTKRPKWHSGKKSKKLLLLDKAMIKTLRIKKKSDTLSKREDKALKGAEERYALCRDAGINGNGNPLAPKDGSPIAHNGTFIGKGIEPVAVTMEVTAGKQGALLTCSLEAQSGTGTVELFPNCTALVTPSDHRNTQVSFTYFASQEVDNRRSNSATITVKWDQEGNFLGDYTSFAPYKTAISDEEAMHLIRWVNLGRDRDALLAIAREKGSDELINALLTPNGSGCTNEELKALAVAQQSMGHVSRIETVFYDTNGDGIADDTDGDGKPNYFSAHFISDPNNKFMWTLQSGQEYWLHMLRYSCEPVRERLALILHNHFALSLGSYSGGGSYRDNYIPSHLSLLRSKIPEANGSLVMPLDLFVSKLHSDGAMLEYLNNINNAWYASTNENYARELMELFTLGPSDIVTNALNYTERDLYELTYSLTGYTNIYEDDERNRGDYCCYPPGMAIPAGGYINPGYRDYCDPQTRCQKAFRKVVNIFDERRWNDTLRPRAQLLFDGTPWANHTAFKANSLAADEDTLTPYLMYSHPGVARYFAARFAASFATLQLNDESLTGLAGTLRQGGFDLIQEMKTVLASSAAFSLQAQSDCVSAPIETMVSFLSLFDLPLVRVTSANLYDIVETATTLSGQSLLNPPSVFGWKECGKITGNKIHNGEYWLASQFWLERLRGITNYINYLDRGIASDGVAFDWKSLLPPSSAERRNPDSIVSHMASTIGITLTTSEHALLVEYLTSVALRSTTTNRVTVVDENSVRAVSLATLSDADFDALWLLKGKGLLELFYTLKRNHIR